MVQHQKEYALNASRKLELNISQTQLLNGIQQKKVQEGNASVGLESFIASTAGDIQVSLQNEFGITVEKKYLISYLKELRSAAVSGKEVIDQSLSLNNADSTKNDIQSLYNYILSFDSNYKTILLGKEQKFQKLVSEKLMSYMFNGFLSDAKFISNLQEDIRDCFYYNVSAELIANYFKKTDYSEISTLGLLKFLINAEQGFKEQLQGLGYNNASQAKAAFGDSNVIDLYRSSSVLAEIKDVSLNISNTLLDKFYINIDPKIIEEFLLDANNLKDVDQNGKVDIDVKELYSYLNRVTKCRLSDSVSEFAEEDNPIEVVAKALTEGTSRDGVQIYLLGEVTAGNIEKGLDIELKRKNPEFFALCEGKVTLSKEQFVALFKYWLIKNNYMKGHDLSNIDAELIRTWNLYAAGSVNKTIDSFKDNMIVEVLGMKIDVSKMILEHINELITSDVVNKESELKSATDNMLNMFSKTIEIYSMLSNNFSEKQKQSLKQLVINYVMLSDLAKNGVLSMEKILGFYDSFLKESSVIRPCLKQAVSALSTESYNKIAVSMKEMSVDDKSLQSLMNEYFNIDAKEVDKAKLNAASKTEVKKYVNDFSQITTYFNTVFSGLVPDNKSIGYNKGEYCPDSLSIIFNVADGSEIVDDRARLLKVIEKECANDPRLRFVHDDKTNTDFVIFRAPDGSEKKLQIEISNLKFKDSEDQTESAFADISRFEDQEDILALTSSLGTESIHDVVVNNGYALFVNYSWTHNKQSRPTTGALSVLWSTIPEGIRSKIPGVNHNSFYLTHKVGNNVVPVYAATTSEVFKAMGEKKFNEGNWVNNFSQFVFKKDLKEKDFESLEGVNAEELSVLKGLWEERPLRIISVEELKRAFPGRDEKALVKLVSFFDQLVFGDKEVFPELKTLQTEIQSCSQGKNANYASRFIENTVVTKALDDRFDVSMHEGNGWDNGLFYDNDPVKVKSANSIVYKNTQFDDEGNPVYEGITATSLVTQDSSTDDLEYLLQLRDFLSEIPASDGSPCFLADKEYTTRDTRFFHSLDRAVTRYKNTYVYTDEMVFAGLNISSRFVSDVESKEIFKLCSNEDNFAEKLSTYIKEKYGVDGEDNKAAVDLITKNWEEHNAIKNGLIATGESSFLARAENLISSRMNTSKKYSRPEAERALESYKEEIAHYEGRIKDSKSTAYQKQIYLQNIVRLDAQRRQFEGLLSSFDKTGEQRLSLDNSVLIIPQKLFQDIRTRAESISKINVRNESIPANEVSETIYKVPANGPLATLNFYLDRVMEAGNGSAETPNFTTSRVIETTDLYRLAKYLNPRDLENTGLQNVQYKVTEIDKEYSRLFIGTIRQVVPREIDAEFIESLQLSKSMTKLLNFVFLDNKKEVFSREDIDALKVFDLSTIKNDELRMEMKLLIKNVVQSFTKSITEKELNTSKALLKFSEYLNSNNSSITEEEFELYVKGDISALLGIYKSLDKETIVLVFSHLREMFEVSAGFLANFSQGDVSRDSILSFLQIRADNIRRQLADMGRQTKEYSAFAPSAEKINALKRVYIADTGQDDELKYISERYDQYMQAREMILRNVNAKVGNVVEDIFAGRPLYGGRVIDAEMSKFIHSYMLANGRVNAESKLTERVDSKKAEEILKGAFKGTKYEEIVFTSDQIENFKVLLNTLYDNSSNTEAVDLRQEAIFLEQVEKQIHRYSSLRVQEYNRFHDSSDPEFIDWMFRNFHSNYRFDANGKLQVSQNKGSIDGDMLSSSDKFKSMFFSASGLSEFLQLPELDFDNFNKVDLFQLNNMILVMIKDALDKNPGKSFSDILRILAKEPAFQKAWSYFINYLPQSEINKIAERVELKQNVKTTSQVKESTAWITSNSDYEYDPYLERYAGPTKLTDSETQQMLAYNAGEAHMQMGAMSMLLKKSPEIQYAYHIKSMVRMGSYSSEVLNNFYSDISIDSDELTLGDVKQLQQTFVNQVKAYNERNPDKPINIDKHANFQALSRLITSMETSGLDVVKVAKDGEGKVLVDAFYALGFVMKKNTVSSSEFDSGGNMELLVHSLGGPLLDPAFLEEVKRNAEWSSINPFELSSDNQTLKALKLTAQWPLKFLYLRFYINTILPMNAMYTAMFGTNNPNVTCNENFEVVYENKLEQFFGNIAEFGGQMLMFRNLITMMMDSFNVYNSIADGDYLLAYWQMNLINSFALRSETGYFRDTLAGKFLSMDKYAMKLFYPALRLYINGHTGQLSDLLDKFAFSTSQKGALFSSLDGLKSLGLNTTSKGLSVLKMVDLPNRYQEALQKSYQDNINRNDWKSVSARALYRGHRFIRKWTQEKPAKFMLAGVALQAYRDSKFNPLNAYKRQVKDSLLPDSHKFYLTEHGLMSGRQSSVDKDVSSKYYEIFRYLPVFKDGSFFNNGRIDVDLRFSDDTSVSPTGKVPISIDIEVDRTGFKTELSVDLVPANNAKDPYQYRLVLVVPEQMLRNQDQNMTVISGEVALSKLDMDLSKKLETIRRQTFRLNAENPDMRTIVNTGEQIKSMLAELRYNPSHQISDQDLKKIADLGVTKKEVKRLIKYCNETGTLLELDNISRQFVKSFEYEQVKNSAERPDFRAIGDQSCEVSLRILDNNSLSKRFFQNGEKEQVVREVINAMIATGELTKITESQTQQIVKAHLIENSFIDAAKITRDMYSQDFLKNMGLEKLLAPVRQDLFRVSKHKNKDVVIQQVMSVIGKMIKANKSLSVEAAMKELMEIKVEKDGKVVSVFEGIEIDKSELTKIKENLSRERAAVDVCKATKEGKSIYGETNKSPIEKIRDRYIALYAELNDPGLSSKDRQTKLQAFHKELSVEDLRAVAAELVKYKFLQEGYIPRPNQMEAAILAQFNRELAMNVNTANGKGLIDALHAVLRFSKNQSTEIRVPTYDDSKQEYVREVKFLRLMGLSVGIFDVGASELKIEDKLFSMDVVYTQGQKSIFRMLFDNRKTKNQQRVLPTAFEMMTRWVCASNEGDKLRVEDAKNPAIISFALDKFFDKTSVESRTTYAADGIVRFMMRINELNNGDKVDLRDFIIIDRNSNSVSLKPDAWNKVIELLQKETYKTIVEEIQSKYNCDLSVLLLKNSSMADFQNRFTGVEEQKEISRVIQEKLGSSLYVHFHQIEGTDYRFNGDELILIDRSTGKASIGSKPQTDTLQAIESKHGKNISMFSTSSAPLTIEMNSKFYAFNIYNSGTIYEYSPVFQQLNIPIIGVRDFCPVTAYVAPRYVAETNAQQKISAYKIFMAQLAEGSSGMFHTKRTSDSSVIDPETGKEVKLGAINVESTRADMDRICNEILYKEWTKLIGSLSDSEKLLLTELSSNKSLTQSERQKLNKLLEKIELKPEHLDAAIKGCSSDIDRQMLEWLRTDLENNKTGERAIAQGLSRVFYYNYSANNYALVDDTGKTLKNVRVSKNGKISFWELRDSSTDEEITKLDISSHQRLGGAITSTTKRNTDVTCSPTRADYEAKMLNLFGIDGGQLGYFSVHTDMLPTPTEVQQDNRDNRPGPGGRKNARRFYVYSMMDDFFERSADLKNSLLETMRVTGKSILMLEASNANDMVKTDFETKISRQELNFINERLFFEKVGLSTDASETKLLQADFNKDTIIVRGGLTDAQFELLKGELFVKNGDLFRFKSELTREAVELSVEKLGAEAVEAKKMLIGLWQDSFVDASKLYKLEKANQMTAMELSIIRNNVSDESFNRGNEKILRIVNAATSLKIYTNESMRTALASLYGQATKELNIDPRNMTEDDVKKIIEKTLILIKELGFEVDIDVSKVKTLKKFSDLLIKNMDNKHQFVIDFRQREYEAAKDRTKKGETDKLSQTFASCRTPIDFYKSFLPYIVDLAFSEAEASLRRQNIIPNAEFIAKEVSEYLKNNFSIDAKFDLNGHTTIAELKEEALKGLDAKLDYSSLSRIYQKDFQDIVVQRLQILQDSYKQVVDELKRESSERVYGNQGEYMWKLQVLERELDRQIATVMSDVLFHEKGLNAYTLKLKMPTKGSYNPVGLSRKALMPLVVRGNAIVINSEFNNENKVEKLEKLIIERFNQINAYGKQRTSTVIEVPFLDKKGNIVMENDKLKMIKIDLYDQEQIRLLNNALEVLGSKKRVMLYSHEQQGIVFLVGDCDVIKKNGSVEFKFLSLDVRAEAVNALGYIFTSEMNLIGKKGEMARTTTIIEPKIQEGMYGRILGATNEGSHKGEMARALLESYGVTSTQIQKLLERISSNNIGEIKEVELEKILGRESSEKIALLKDLLLTKNNILKDEVPSTRKHLAELLSGEFTEKEIDKIFELVSLIKSEQNTFGESRKQVRIHEGKHEKDLKRIQDLSKLADANIFHQRGHIAIERSADLGVDGRLASILNVADDVVRLQELRSFFTVESESDPMVKEIYEKVKAPGGEINQELLKAILIGENGLAAKVDAHFERYIRMCEEHAKVLGGFPKTDIGLENKEAEIKFFIDQLSKLEESFYKEWKGNVEFARINGQHSELTVSQSANESNRLQAPAVEERLTPVDGHKGVFISADGKSIRVDHTDYKDHESFVRLLNQLKVDGVISSLEDVRITYTDKTINVTAEQIKAIASLQMCQDHWKALQTAMLTKDSPGVTIEDRNINGVKVKVLKFNSEMGSELQKREYVVTAETYENFVKNNNVMETILKNNGLPYTIESFEYIRKINLQLMECETTKDTSLFLVNGKDVGLEGKNFDVIDGIKIVKGPDEDKAIHVDMSDTQLAMDNISEISVKIDGNNRLFFIPTTLLQKLVFANNSSDCDLIKSTLSEVRNVLGLDETKIDVDRVDVEIMNSLRDFQDAQRQDNKVTMLISERLNDMAKVSLNDFVRTTRYALDITKIDVQSDKTIQERYLETVVKDVTSLIESGQITNEKVIKGLEKIRSRAQKLRDAVSVQGVSYATNQELSLVIREVENAKFNSSVRVLKVNCFSERTRQVVDPMLEEVKQIRENIDKEIDDTKKVELSQQVELIEKQIRAELSKDSFSNDMANRESSIRSQYYMKIYEQNIYREVFRVSKPDFKGMSSESKSIWARCGDISSDKQSFVFDTNVEKILNELELKHQNDPERLAVIKEIRAQVAAGKEIFNDPARLSEISEKAWIETGRVGKHNLSLDNKNTDYLRLTYLRDNAAYDSRLMMRASGIAYHAGSGFLTGLAVNFFKKVLIERPDIIKELKGKDMDQMLEVLAHHFIADGAKEGIYMMKFKASLEAIKVVLQIDPSKLGSLPGGWKVGGNSILKIGAQNYLSDIVGPMTIYYMGMMSVRMKDEVRKGNYSMVPKAIGMTIAESAAFSTGTFVGDIAIQKGLAPLASKLLMGRTKGVANFMLERLPFGLIAGQILMHYSMGYIQDSEFAKSLEVLGETISKSDRGVNFLKSADITADATMINAANYYSGRGSSDFLISFYKSLRKSNVIGTDKLARLMATVARSSLMKNMSNFFATNGRFIKGGIFTVVAMMMSIYRNQDGLFQGDDGFNKEQFNQAFRNTAIDLGGVGVVAVSGYLIGIVATEAAIAAGLAPETLGISIVVGGVVIVGTALVGWGYTEIKEWVINDNEDAYNYIQGEFDKRFGKGSIKIKADNVLEEEAPEGDFKGGIQRSFNANLFQMYLDPKFKMGYVGSMSKYGALSEYIQKRVKEGKWNNTSEMSLTDIMSDLGVKELDVKHIYLMSLDMLLTMMDAAAKAKIDGVVPTKISINGFSKENTKFGAYGLTSKINILVIGEDEKTKTQRAISNKVEVCVADYGSENVRDINATDGRYLLREAGVSEEGLKDVKDVSRDLFQDILFDEANKKARPIFMKLVGILQDRSILKTLLAEYEKVAGDYRMGVSGKKRRLEMLIELLNNKNSKEIQDSLDSFWENSWMVTREYSGILADALILLGDKQNGKEFSLEGIMNKNVDLQVIADIYSASVATSDLYGAMSDLKSKRDVYAGLQKEMMGNGIESIDFKAIDNKEIKEKLLLTHLSTIASSWKEGDHLTMIKSLGDIVGGWEQIPGLEGLDVKQLFRESALYNTIYGFLSKRLNNPMVAGFILNKLLADDETQKTVNSDYEKKFGSEVNSRDLSEFGDMIKKTLKDGYLNSDIMLSDADILFMYKTFKLAQSDFQISELKDKKAKQEQDTSRLPYFRDKLQKMDVSAFDDSNRGMDVQLYMLYAKHLSKGPEDDEHKLRVLNEFIYKGLGYDAVWDVKEDWAEDKIMLAFDIVLDISNSEKKLAIMGTLLQAIGDYKPQLVGKRIAEINNSAITSFMDQVTAAKDAKQLIPVLDSVMRLMSREKDASKIESYFKIIDGIIEKSKDLKFDVYGEIHSKYLWHIKEVAKNINDMDLKAAMNAGQLYLVMNTLVKLLKEKPSKLGSKLNDCDVSVSDALYIVFGAGIKSNDTAVRITALSLLKNKGYNDLLVPWQRLRLLKDYSRVASGISFYGNSSAEEKKMINEIVMFQLKYINNEEEFWQFIYDDEPSSAYFGNNVTVWATALYQEIMGVKTYPVNEYFPEKSNGNYGPMGGGMSFRDYGKKNQQRYKEEMVYKVQEHFKKHVDVKTELGLLALKYENLSNAELVKMVKAGRLEEETPLYEIPYFLRERIVR